MWVFLKRIVAELTSGMLFSARPELRPLDLDRDWPDLDRMMQLEEWPFVRGDFEVSHAQPRSTSFVAHKDGEFAGFFTTHHFGDIGYLDMMIIPKAFRSVSVARPLYFTTLGAMKKKGLRSFVAHSTNDSARILKLIGFEPGLDFTLLARDPAPAAAMSSPLEIDEDLELEELVQLDAEIFGMRRETWQRSLREQPDIELIGARSPEGQLVGSVCLRPRREGALCLDQVNALDEATLSGLTTAAIERHANRRLECFARTDSALHRELTRGGFEVPEFFVPIGPLIEWRKGETGDVGLSDRVQSLSWL